MPHNPTPEKSKSLLQKIQTAAGSICDAIPGLAGIWALIYAFDALLVGSGNPAGTATAVMLVLGPFFVFIRN